MTTLTARYKDGVIYPITKIDLSKLKEKVFQLIIVDEEMSVPEKQNTARESLEAIKKSNPFGSIDDVIKWQKEEREEREIFS